MSKKIIQIRQHEHVMQLTWVINNICTNHCDYCPPTLHTGTNHHYEWDKAKNFIKRLFGRYHKIHCSISGGEPTVSPFFSELVNMFYDNGHTVGITSNGARNVRYWEEIAPKLSYICFSYHPSYEDINFLEKVKTAAKYTHVAVRVMMDSRYWEKAYDFYNLCSNIPYIRAEPVRILAEMADRHVGDEYSESQNVWLNKTTGTNSIQRLYLENNPGWRESSTGASFYYDDGSYDPSGNTNHIISSGQNDFRGWACNIGLESLFVHFDGWVKKGNCFQGGNLFHIDDHENHSLPDSAEICYQKICHCGTDVMISKAAIFDKDHDIVKNNTQIRTPKTEEEYNRAYRSYANKIPKRPVIKITPTSI